MLIADVVLLSQRMLFWEHEGNRAVRKGDSLGPSKSPWPMRGQNARHTGRALKKWETFNETSNA